MRYQQRRHAARLIHDLGRHIGCLANAISNKLGASVVNHLHGSWIIDRCDDITSRVDLEPVAAQAAVDFFGNIATKRRGVFPIGPSSLGMMFSPVCVV